MRSKRKKRWFQAVCILLALILSVGVVGYIEHIETQHKLEEQKEKERIAAVERARRQRELERKKEIEYRRKLAAEKDKLTKKKIYSFLQGPIAYEEKKKWAGKWCYKEIEGNSFGAFGCGLCCMANIYVTLSGRECSPWKVLKFARSHSKYAPNGSVGAIDWKAMAVSMKKMGLTCRLSTKPKTFKSFEKELLKSKTAICLVCSYDDATFWPSTSGHYVNVWLYNKKKETVFIAEPGNNVNNRLTIDAHLVYDALKSNSDYQVLFVTGYDESKDKFKPTNGIRIKWNRPKYLKKPAYSKY